MKKEFSIWTIVLVMISGLGGCKQTEEQKSVINIDVAKNYSKKEIVLQDILDVEYIALETNDEFLTKGNVLAIGEKYILTKNWSNDGNIYLFDRSTGKGLRVINRKGKGAEEYNYINEVVLDEEKDEIFVNSSSIKKIMVYDTFGNFKRSLKHKDDAQYLSIFDYDKDNLICYDMSVYYKGGENRGSQSYHMIISKQDGSITRDIYIPYDVIKSPSVKDGDAFAVTSVRTIVPNKNNWLLVETSTDTVYNYNSSTNQLTPFLVKDPTENPDIFLSVGTLTDRYYFFETVKKVFDFKTRRGFPTSSLMYDRQEKSVYKSSVINGDFVKKQGVNMTSKPLNRKIATYQNIEAYKLVEALKNDGLKGKLKEIAAKLNENSNPVIMIMKYKK